MWRRSLAGLTHTRLRMWLLLFFFALAIPTAVLVKQTYGQMKWEALHQHRILAEELAARIDNHIGRLIRHEELRSFTDYRFLVVAGDPAAQLVQRSPLAAYPVSTDIPGLIGYFQIDSDGVFSSPLLPQAGSDSVRYGVAPVELKQRQALVMRIQELLGNRLLGKTRSRVSADGIQLAGDMAHGSEREHDRAETAAPAAQPGISDIQEQVAGQALFDQLSQPAAPQQKNIRLKTPGSLGRVEDLKLDERFDSASQFATPETATIPVESNQEIRTARKEYSTLAESELPLPGSTPVRIHAFESELDPFEFSQLNTGHFVLFRKVWRDGQRYIQGMVIEQKPFLNGAIETAFRDTALSRMSELIVAFRAEVVAAYSNDEERGYLTSTKQLGGALLHRTRLSAPLGDLELIFTVTRLPASPGATLVNWLVTILSLVLCAGFYSMYRLGARQIELAQQQQDFVSAVSHELKTPLTSIRMYSEMLREGWASEEKKTSYYDFIHDESERLSRLIGNVLQLARMTRNDLQLSIKRVKAGELMDGIRSLVSSQTEHAGFELTMTIEENVDQAVVEVDSDAFTQIMINLVDNAIKFSAAADRKAIDISCSVLPDRQIQFVVRDFGPGIPRDQMKNIFRLFYRSGNELTRETVGTGIGLALVLQLASAMHGKVDVDNRQPGAEFRVLFPRVENG